MSDIVELMRTGRVCDDKCRVMEARSGCLCAEAADEIERLRAALLTGVLMLSEMGLDPREKCQMAYDYMSAALEDRT